MDTNTDTTQATIDAHNDASMADTGLTVGDNVAADMATHTVAHDADKVDADMAQNGATVAADTSKAVAKAKRRNAKKATRKAAKAVKAAVAKGDQPKATKPEGDAYLGAYPKLKAWPKAAGAAPTRMHIVMARALLNSPRAAGSKRELAIAAYLRDDAASVNTHLVAKALADVVGGTLNPLLNVVNRDVAGANGLNLGKCIKAKVEGGTSYRLELNARGKARVAKYLATHGMGDAEFGLSSVSSEGDGATA